MAKQIKTIKKAPVKKPVVKKEPVMEHECGCGKDCPCGCHKHGTAHVLKHIIILAIVFALGMVAGKSLYFGPAKYKPMHKVRQNPVFTNGCLDIQTIKSEKRRQDVLVADVNGDNCISVEEYKEWKKANRPDPKKQGFGHGFKKPGK